MEHYKTQSVIFSPFITGNAATTLTTRNMIQCDVGFWDTQGYRQSRLQDNYGQLGKLQLLTKWTRRTTR